MNPDNEYYEYVVYKNDVMVEPLNKALDIVRKFIKDRQLILVGGMAIDYALRLKGKRLYSDNIIPDYDFISTNFIEDSRDLGEILCKADMENVSIINALHINTIKVRVNFVTVADITYNPKFIFNSIPTLKWEGIRFIHPNYQKIDMHLSISHPLNYPPLENVYFRAKKDMTRFQMLEDEYPITLKTIDKSLKSDLPKPQKSKISPQHTLSDILPTACIGGLSAYYIYKDMYKTKSIKYSLSTIKTRNNKYMIYTDTPTEDLQLLLKNKNIKVIKHDTYAPILDRLLPRTEIETKEHNIITLFHNHGNKVAARQITINDISTYVVNPQEVLLYLLYMYYSKLAQDTKSSQSYAKMYYTMYVTLRDMITDVSSLDSKDNKLAEYFCPYVQSYGTLSLSHSAELMTRPIQDKLDDKQQQYRPKNIYPKRSKDKKTDCKPVGDETSNFNLQTAEYYKIDGRVIL